MRTPAGRECAYFYGDYHRGRNVEVCRLLEHGDSRWQPSLCETCPVPDILLANACPNLVLHGSVGRRLGLWRQVRVVATCDYTGTVVPEPKVGCGHCAEFAE